MHSAYFSGPDSPYILSALHHFTDGDVVAALEMMQLDVVRRNISNNKIHDTFRIYDSLILAYSNMQNDQTQM